MLLWRNDFSPLGLDWMRMYSSQFTCVEVDWSGIELNSIPFHSNTCGLRWIHMHPNKALCVFQCCCDDWLGWTVSTYCWFANSRADAVQRNYGGACVQMRLSFSSLAPFFLYFIQWLDCGCCYALPSYFGLFHILICKVKLQYVVLEFGPLIFVSLYRRPGCRELKSSCFVYTGLC